MKNERLNSGFYKLDDDLYIPKLLKFYAKEIILSVLISMAIIIEIYVIYAIYFDIIFIQMMFFLLNSLGQFLLIDTYYYNRKYPRNKTSDVFLMLLALMFFNFNFMITISTTFPDLALIFNENTIYGTNLIIAIGIFSILLYKLLVYKVKQHKGEDANRPTVIIYLTSTFTISFYSLSIYSTISDLATIIYLLNMILGIMVLILILVKSLLIKMRISREKIYSKALLGFYILVVIFLVATILILMRFFGYIIHWYEGRSHLFVLEYEHLFSIWNMDVLIYHIIIITIINAFIIIVESKDDKIIFDWRDYSKRILIFKKD